MAASRMLTMPSTNRSTRVQGCAKGSASLSLRGLALRHANSETQITSVLSVEQNENISMLTWVTILYLPLSFIAVRPFRNLAPWRVSVLTVYLAGRLRHGPRRGTVLGWPVPVRMGKRGVRGWHRYIRAELATHHSSSSPSPRMGREGIREGQGRRPEPRAEAVHHPVVGASGRRRSFLAAHETERAWRARRTAGRC